MVGVFERSSRSVPVFRAEPHETVRHLAEYVSLDAEMGFIRDHRDVMAVLARSSPEWWSDGAAEEAPVASDLLKLAPTRSRGDPRHSLSRGPAS